MPVGDQFLSRNKQASKQVLEAVTMTTMTHGYNGIANYERRVTL